jgi:hypothetical protein
MHTRFAREREPPALAVEPGYVQAEAKMFGVKK